MIEHQLFGITVGKLYTEQRMKRKVYDFLGTFLKVF